MKYPFIFYPFINLSVIIVTQFHHVFHIAPSLYSIGGMQAYKSRLSAQWIRNRDQHTFTFHLMCWLTWENHQLYSIFHKNVYLGTFAHCDARVMYVHDMPRGYINISLLVQYIFTLVLHLSVRKDELPCGRPLAACLNAPARFPRCAYKSLHTSFPPAPSMQAGE